MEGDSKPSHGHHSGSYSETFSSLTISAFQKAIVRNTRVFEDCSYDSGDELARYLGY